MRGSGLSMLSGIALASIVANHTTAQTREDWRRTEQQEDATDPSEQRNSYTGVTPGAGNALPRVAELKSQKGNWVTWPGFIANGNKGTRLFLQTTSTLDFKTRQAGNKTLIIEIQKASVYLGNNHNPLDTHYFDTPLARAFLRRKGNHVELVLELKHPTEPAITQTTNDDGYSYLFVDFPPKGAGTSEPRRAP